jgi:hypothetical protein
MPTGGFALTRESTPSAVLVRVSLYVVYGWSVLKIIGILGETYLADGLLIGDGVGCGCGFVSRLKGVADERGAEGFDHEFVVVQGGDDDGGGGAADGGLDVRGRHFGVGVVGVVDLGN